VRIRSAVCAALLATGVAGPLATQSAFADAPGIDRAVAFGGSFDDGGETCGSFGVLFTYSGVRTYIDFYAADGSLVKEIRHITFTGTLTNDITGASVPYSGRFTRTFDAVANSITITGQNDKVGGVPVTTGRSVYWIDSDTATASGKDQFDQVVCAALS
jgi:hypothetical protein